MQPCLLNTVYEYTVEEFFVIFFLALLYEVEPKLDKELKFLALKDPLGTRTYYTYWLELSMKWMISQMGVFSKYKKMC